MKNVGLGTCQGHFPPAFHSPDKQHMPSQSQHGAGTPNPRNRAASGGPRSQQAEEAHPTSSLWLQLPPKSSCQGYRPFPFSPVILQAWSLLPFPQGNDQSIPGNQFYQENRAEKLKQSIHCTPYTLFSVEHTQRQAKYWFNWFIPDPNAST